MKAGKGKEPRPEPGDVMPDGTIYAGISPDTRKPFYVAATDAPANPDFIMAFNKASACAEKLTAHGYDDWRLPTKAELDLLFRNREKGALKGTFNLTGSEDAGWYWSSTRGPSGGAWGQRFSDGIQDDYGTSVRCVRQDI
jgi:hypothetical protein